MSLNCSLDFDYEYVWLLFLSDYQYNPSGRKYSELLGFRGFSELTATDHFITIS